MKNAELQGPTTNRWFPGVGTRKWSDYQKGDKREILRTDGAVHSNCGSGHKPLCICQKSSNCLAKTVNFTVFKFKTN